MFIDTRLSRVAALLYDEVVRGTGDDPSKVMWLWRGQVVPARPFFGVHMQTVAAPSFDSLLGVFRAPDSITITPTGVAKDANLWINGWLYHVDDASDIAQLEAALAADPNLTASVVGGDLLVTPAPDAYIYQARLPEDRYTLAVSTTSTPIRAKVARGTAIVDLQAFWATHTAAATSMVPIQIGTGPLEAIYKLLAHLDSEETSERLRGYYMDIGLVSPVDAVTVLQGNEYENRAATQVEVRHSAIKLEPVTEVTDVTITIEQLEFQ